MWDRKKKWQKIIEGKGGKCQRCGGVFHYSVYDLHHRNPSEKEIAIGADIQNISLARLMEEAEKCDLLCANCHRLTHFGEEDG